MHKPSRETPKATPKATANLRSKGQPTSSTLNPTALTNPRTSGSQKNNPSFPPAHNPPASRLRVFKRVLPQAALAKTDGASAAAVDTRKQDEHGRTVTGGYSFEFDPLLHM